MSEEEFIKDLELNFNLQLWKFKKYNDEYTKLKIRIKDMKISDEIKTKFGIISPETYKIEEILKEIESKYYLYKYVGNGTIAEILKEELWFLISLLIWKLYY